jgi:hypothetical protein
MLMSISAHHLPLVVTVLLYVLGGRNRSNVRPLFAVLFFMYSLQIRERALIQYTFPFSSVNLASMAAAFNTSVP